MLRDERAKPWLEAISPVNIGQEGGRDKAAPLPGLSSIDRPRGILQPTSREDHPQAGVIGRFSRVVVQTFLRSRAKSPFFFFFSPSALSPLLSHSRSGISASTNSSSAIGAPSPRLKPSFTIRV